MRTKTAYSALRAISVLAIILVAYGTWVFNPIKDVLIYLLPDSTPGYTGGVNPNLLVKWSFVIGLGAYALRLVIRFVSEWKKDRITSLPLLLFPLKMTVVFLWGTLVVFYPAPILVHEFALIWTLFFALFTLHGAVTFFPFLLIASYALLILALLISSMMRWLKEKKSVK